MSGLDVGPADEDEAADYEIEVTPTESVDDGIDVETSDDASRIDVDVSGPDEPVDGPSYVLYGGKGGVGKTTMAAATALDSARDGRSTLVVSTDPAHSLSDALETDVPSSPERLREDVPLYGVEIDPEAAMEAGETPFTAGGGFESGTDATGSDGTGPFAGGEEGPFAGGEEGPFAGGESNPFAEGGEGPFGEDGLGGIATAMGGENPMEGLLGGTMPGADEAAAVQLLLEYLDDDRFDRVVVDTAPTGHTLRLLELPELLDSMVGRMLTIRQRIGSMFEGLKGLFGAGTEAEDAFDVDDLRELSDRIERLRAALRDPDRTDFRIVMVPEEMSVMESERLREQLQSSGIPVGTLVVNRVMEPLAAVTDAVDGAFLSPNLDDCAFCQRRWDVQQNALGAAQDLFRGTDVKRVPLFADEVRGEEMLGVVAACLR
ncbi:ArsA family ATPase [Halovivax gelatinilyticus]|uniref:ArsA family ATPase n=1 Tax=Halovivax gelatinilyticus TaxID=2961597 RepID=UPI0020CA6EB3|nr:ArsA family ATPase [Halovivax gelatinilyticus]